MLDNHQASAQQPKDINDWFNEVASPFPTPEKKPRNRFTLIIIAAAALTLAGLVILLLTLNTNKTTCLTKDDYYDLTGIRYLDTIEPKTSFYTGFINFSDNTAQFKGEEDEATIAKLQDFYTSRLNKPLVFTVSSNYQSSDTLELTQNRIDKASESLHRAGVPTSSVYEYEPLYSPAEEPEEDASVQADNQVALTITSAETCK